MGSPRGPALQGLSAYLLACLHAREGMIKSGRAKVTITRIGLAMVLSIVCAGTLTLTSATAARAQVIVGSAYSGDDFVSFSFVGTPDADSVWVDVGGDPLELRDPDGALVYGGCQLLEPGHASCARFEGNYLGELRAGDDRVAITGLMDGRIGLGAGNDVFTDGSGAGDGAGGLGNDRLDGGLGDDAIRGGRGADRLRGGAGRDRVNGEEGEDVLLGGAGPDRILADDNRRDLRIDCGPGDDRVLIDSGLDPRPRHCEDIRSR